MPPRNPQTPSQSPEAPQRSMNRRGFIIGMTVGGALVIAPSYLPVGRNESEESDGIATTPEPETSLDTTTTFPEATSTSTTELVEPEQIPEVEPLPLSAELREKAEKIYNTDELIAFAKSTEWFGESVDSQLDAMRAEGISVPDPDELEPETYEARADARTVFTRLISAANEDIKVAYDYDPYQEKPLPNIDADLDAKTLTSHLYGLADALGSYPKPFLANLKKIFINEDRSVVTENGHEKTSDNYLSVINVPGPNTGSLVASIRGLWPESAVFDMAHEGTHVLQTNDNPNELFQSVKDRQPPLEPMLVWFNENSASLEQPALVRELLENCEQTVDYEDQAGAITATIRNGFIELPEQPDETTEEYLLYLRDKQIAAVEWASQKTGVDMFAFMAFRKEFGHSHPDTIVGAYENGTFVKDSDVEGAEIAVEQADIDDRVAAFNSAYDELKRLQDSGAPLPDNLTITETERGKSLELHNRDDPSIRTMVSFTTIGIRNDGLPMLYIETTRLIDEATTAEWQAENGIPSLDMVFRQEHYHLSSIEEADVYPYYYGSGLAEGSSISIPVEKGDVSREQIVQNGLEIFDGFFADLKEEMPTEDLTPGSGGN